MSSDRDDDTNAPGPDDDRDEVSVDRMFDDAVAHRLEATDLETQAADACRRMKGRGRSAEEKKEVRYRRNRFLIFWSAVVVAVVLSVSFFQGANLFNTGTATLNRGEHLIPFLLCFVGVALFVMNTARRKGDDWEFGRYYGDQAYRVAQAFGYLLVVWWAWASAVNVDVQGTSLPPNILGFLVGLFILRVERAMEGLGDKFEEALKAVLPRAIAYQTAEERKRNQLRGMYRIEDILSEWKGIRPQMDDLGARDMIDRAFDRAVEDAHGEDPEKARQSVEEVGRLFDDVRRRAGEVLMPIEDLLGPPG